MNSCPLCHQNTIQRVDNLYCCQRKECTFIYRNPISYVDEVVKCRQELNKQISRISFKEDEFLATQKGKFIKSCKKVIFDTCHFLKYPEFIGNSAMMMISNLIKMDAFQLLNINKVQNESKISHFSSSLVIKKAVSYILYVVCIQNKFLFQELKIAKYFCFTFKDWKQNIGQQNSRAKQHINDLPPMRSPSFLINKICFIRKIRQEQKQAMLKLGDNFDRSGRDCIAATIASIAFWKICEFSCFYNKDFELQEICRGHQLLYNSLNLNTVEKIEKYFDITSEYLQKAFKKYFEQHFFSKYLPYWQGRDETLIVQMMNIMHENNFDAAPIKEKLCQKKPLQLRKRK